MQQAIKISRLYALYFFFNQNNLLNPWDIQAGAFKYDSFIYNILLFYVFIN